MQLLHNSILSGPSAVLERGLPSNPDAERFVLGSILLNDDCYPDVATVLAPEDFALEKHRRIFARMKDLYDGGENIDRITIADELGRPDLSDIAR
jgi:replicative DNA helicase